MHAYTCVRTHVFVRAFTHIFAHVYTHVYAHVYTQVYAHVYAQAVERHPMNRVFALKDLVDILKLTHKSVYPKFVSNAQVCSVVYGGRHNH